METYQHFLVVVDEQSLNTAAIDRALHFARQTKASVKVLLFSSQTRLRTLMRWVNSESQHTEISQQTVRESWQQLNTYVLEHCQNGVEIRLLDNVSYNMTELLAVIYRYQIDTVFVTPGSHDFWHKFAIPSIDLQLIAHSPCPVFIVKEHVWAAGGNILCAVEPCSRDKLHLALTEKLVEDSAQISKLLLGECHFIDCYFGEDNSMSLDDNIELISNHDRHLNSLSDYCRRAKMNHPHFHLELDLPEDAIVRTADEIDSELVIIGTLGQKNRLFQYTSHTSEQILDRVHCDLLVVKPDDFASSLYH